MNQDYTQNQTLTQTLTKRLKQFSKNSTQLITHYKTSLKKIKLAATKKFINKSVIQSHNQFNQRFNSTIKLRQKLIMYRNRNNLKQKNRILSLPCQDTTDFKLSQQNSRSKIQLNINKKLISKINYKQKQKQKPIYKIQIPQLSFAPSQNISALSYIIFQNPDIIHLSQNSHLPLEIASLTKIMTSFLIIKLTQQNNISLNSTIQIDLFSVNISGTTANLKKGQIYHIQSLLYALMLPSGNDAALVLAIWGGKLLCEKSKNKQQSFRMKKKQAIALFIIQMNKMALKLGLKNTNYANPHGLTNTHNRSTAYDIAKLSSIAMENRIFRKIVGSICYSSQVKDKNGGNRKVNWQNTNLLLKKSDYIGIKTGITKGAGGCLASCFKYSNKKECIMVLLGCESVEKRFIQTQILKDWMNKRMILKRRRCEQQSSNNI